MSKLLVFILVLISLGINAQNVGINNTDPQSTLDIKGSLRLRPQVLNVQGQNAITVPEKTSHLWVDGTPTGDVTITYTFQQEGDIMYISNFTSYHLVMPGAYSVGPGISSIMYIDGEWRPINENNSGWTQTGNSGTNPTQNFIGTTDNQPLMFKTNNIERMQIKSSNDANELNFNTDLDKKNRITFENSGEVEGDPFGVKLKMETVSYPLFFHGINFSSESPEYPDFNKQNILHIGADGNIGVGGKSPYGKLYIGHRASNLHPTLALVDSSETNLGGSILNFRKFDALSDFSIKSLLGPDNEADQSSLRFAWSGYNLLNLRGDGRLGLYNIGNNSGIELGYNFSGKQTDAGKIQYGGFGGGDHVVNLVGGGTDPSGNDRMVKIWAEGGTVFTGSTLVNGFVDINNVLKIQGNSGTLGQILVSNGPTSPPSWQSLSTASNTNFHFGSTNSDQSGDFNVNYSSFNTNPTVVYLSGGRMYFNETGLYHLEIELDANVNLDNSFNGDPPFIELGCYFYGTPGLGAQGNHSLFDEVLLKSYPATSTYRRRIPFRGDYFIAAGTSLEFTFSYIHSPSTYTNYNSNLNCRGYKVN